MCIHGDPGRAEEEEEHNATHHQRHKAKGGIFANAASVLSMAAEEISLDDHLEKELANEVELWRMETTSAAVQRAAFGHGLAGAEGQGLSGLTLAGHAAVPFAERRGARDSRSVSPPPRTQVSLHNRVGGGLVGAVAGTVLQRRAAGSAAAATPRTSPHGSPRGPRPDPASAVGPSAPAGEDGCQEQGRSAPQRSREPSPAATEMRVASDLAEELDEGAPFVNWPFARLGLEAAGLAVERPCERSVQVDPSDGLFEGPPGEVGDYREVDGYSSSDESTFAGFIEDPLEQQRIGEAEAWVGAMQNSKGPGRSPSSMSEAVPRRR